MVLAAVACAAACAEPTEPHTVSTHVADWRDEIIYQIVVDRFANGDPDNDSIDGVGVIDGDLARYQGGDWAGIRQRLDYFDALGVSVLWISPINANVARTDYQDGYHGYWASDFASLNPRFGDLSALRELVDAAHARGIKLIIDVVANHTGRVFYYDMDRDRQVDDGELEPPFMADNAPPEQIAWLMPRPRLLRRGADGEVTPLELAAEDFHRHGQTTDGSAMQKQLGDFPTGLRDLDTESDAVVDGLIDTFTYWVEQTDVDGFRLDAVPHAPHAFWQRFATGVRERLADVGKRNFLLLGEVFDGDPERLASYTEAGGLDAVLDFSFKFSLVDQFIYDGVAASEIAWVLDRAADAYPTTGHANGLGLSPWQARVAFAANHDVPRLRYWLDDPWAAELAMTAVFTADAIPCVYYGTEQELDGGWGNASREPLWNAGYATDTRMFRHLSRLARLRRSSAALRRGRLMVRYASDISARERGPGAGLLVFERATDSDRVLVVLNSHPSERARTVVCTGFIPGTVLLDSLTTTTSAVVDGDGCVAVDAPPRGALILRPAQ